MKLKHFSVSGRLHSDHKSATAVVILIAVLLAWRLSWLTALMERDEGTFGYVAMLWTNGLLPYVHTFDNKMPLTYLLYGAAIRVFGNNMLPVRAFNDLLFVVAMAAMYVLVRGWYGRIVGLLASGLFGILMNVPALEGPLAMTESFGASFATISVALSAAYLTRGQAWMLWASSMLAAAAFMVKQSFGLTVLPLIVMVIWKPYRQEMVAVVAPDGRALPSQAVGRVRETIVGSAGFVLVPSLFALYFAHKGALANFLRLTGSVRSYVSNANYIPAGTRYLLLLEVLPFALPALLGIAVAASRRRPPDLITLLWFFTSAMVAVLPPSYGHYWLQVVPSASILAGLGIAEGLGSLRKVAGRSTAMMMRAAVLASALLLFISLPLSVHLQLRQFPDMNLSLGFVQWRYADEETYNQQVTLGTYLRTASADSPILIHGWSPGAYWLADKVAPTKDVWSVQAFGVHVEQASVDKLMDMLRTRELSHVVLFSPSRAELLRRKDDPIVRHVLRHYYETTSIGNAQVFAAYNQNGSFVWANLLDAFRSSGACTLRQGRPEIVSNITRRPAIYHPEVRQVEIAGEAVDAIFQHPLPYGRGKDQMVSCMTFALHVPREASLEFLIGMDPVAWNKPGEGVVFETYIVRQRARLMFSKYIDPKHVASDRRWVQERIDLSPFAEQKVEVVLVTRPGPAGDNAWDWAHWGNPMIVRR